MRIVVACALFAPSLGLAACSGAEPPIVTDDASVQPTGDSFSLTYRGTQGYASKESDLGAFEGVYAVRDAETLEHIATGIVDGTVAPAEPFKDSFAFTTKSVLQRGRSYELGISLRGRSECMSGRSRRHLYYMRFENVNADVVVEKPFANQFQADEACAVIEVKTKLAAGVYSAAFARSTVDIVVSPTGRIYRGSAELQCVAPTQTKCNGIGTSMTCENPLVIEENGEFYPGTSGNYLDFNVIATAEGESIRLKGKLGGCCNEPFDLLAKRVGPGAPQCK